MTETTRINDNLHDPTSTIELHVSNDSYRTAALRLLSEFRSTGRGFGSIGEGTCRVCGQHGVVTGEVTPVGTPTSHIVLNLICRNGEFFWDDRVFAGL